MLPVEFSRRADIRFQQADTYIQQQIRDRLRDARNDPQAHLDRNYGYKDYTLEVSCPLGENHLVIVDWKRGFNERNRLHVLTLGPESQINR